MYQGPDSVCECLIYVSIYIYVYTYIYTYGLFMYMP